MNEFMAWLMLLLLAQWLFGNLYEAVALVPNLMSLIELKSASGEPLFRWKRKSPVAYYIPTTSLTMVTASALVATSLRGRRQGTAYIMISCLLFLAGTGITVYVVRNINLDLFFRPQIDLSRTGKQLRVWTALNFIRLLLAAASLITLISLDQNKLQLLISVRRCWRRMCA